MKAESKIKGLVAKDRMKFKEIQNPGMELFNTIQNSWSFLAVCSDIVLNYAKEGSIFGLKSRCFDKNKTSYEFSSFI